MVRLAGGRAETVEMVIVVTKPMTYAQKRDTLLSFLELWKISEPARTERWSRFPGQNGGLAKVVSGFDYAANFSSVACVA
jgi:hypothetical protein